MALSALVAAAAIGLGRALAAAEWSTRGDSLWAGPAIGLAYIAGQAAIARPSFPPVDVTDRIPWLALAAMLLAVAEAIWPFAARLRFLGRTLLLTLILGLMLGPVISAGDLTWTTIGWLAAAAVTAVLAWLNFWAHWSNIAGQGCVPRLDADVGRGGSGPAALGKRRALPAVPGVDGLTGRRPDCRMAPCLRKRAHRWRGGPHGSRN